MSKDGETVLLIMVFIIMLSTCNHGHNDVKVYIDGEEVTKDL